MKLSLKKIGVAALASIASLGMVGALSACGSGTASNGETSITIFNSKSEIQRQFQQMAKEYSASHHVNVTVYYSSDTVSSHLATKYASGEPYTLSMVDAKDVYSLAKEHAVDMSNQKWVKDTKYAIAIDGKTYGFPVSIEARGLLYNADAIKKATGKEFKPSDYKTLAKFKTLLSELKAKGMPDGAVGLQKEDWSLAGHYLPQVYEEHKDPQAFVESLHAGKVNLNQDPVFTSLMDTWEVLRDNNYAKASAISAEREVTEQKLAQGKIAFMWGGNWDWSVLNQYNPSKNMGVMPVPQDNPALKANEKLLGGGSKYFFIDHSSHTSAKQVKAAEDFLNWMVYNKDGKKFVVDTCNLVSPFSNNTLSVSDPLGKSVKQFADNNGLLPGYNYLPDDHYSILGANMQKYLAGQESRSDFAKQVEAYWKTAKISGPGK